MRSQNLTTAILAGLLCALAGSAQTQTPADLLQKGIHAQETVGDVDSAIQIFRQVVNNNNGNRPLAAQAQYQLVLCMLQKGDRSAAAKEFDELRQKFADQHDLVSKAGKLMGGGTGLLPAPWPAHESLQLNIKKGGVYTGGYLFYSVSQVGGHVQPPSSTDNYWVSWELDTKATSHRFWIEVDRDTMQQVGKQRHMQSDDELGDPAVAPFVGPATDYEQTMSIIRRLPLAVGYTTTLPVTSWTAAAKSLELKVTGVEAVQAPAGKFNCFKVTFPAIGQTFWFGVEGARPLVKFQSGDVEAELMKAWGPAPLRDTAMAFLQTGGWQFYGAGPQSPDANWSFGASEANGQIALQVEFRELYTPPGDIEQALRKSMEKAGKYDPWNNSSMKIRPESIQERLIGGKHALSCIADYVYQVTPADQRRQHSIYYVWIRTENSSVQFSHDAESDLAIFRWKFDPVLETARIP